MERVTGTGGIFFTARDPRALAAWYEERGGTVSSGKLRWFTLRWFTLRWFTLRWSPRSVRRSARRAGG